MIFLRIDRRTYRFSVAISRVPSYETYISAFFKLVYWTELLSFVLTHQLTFSKDMALHRFD